MDEGMATSGDDETALATDAAAVTPAPGDTGSGMATGDLVAGRYRITRFVGGGGMGNVYAAVDTELGEPLAIKMLRRGLTEDAVERFRTEVKLQRRITHKNVARIFDIGEHAGEKLLTMELVDGESLAARLQRLGKLPLPELRPILTDVLTGLAAAHAAGVIHLDLKPGNVLLARDGRAVIADFGIARAGAAAEGEVAGTPVYMAPEQHMGDAGLDRRADLFAFGVMAYELATGARPFTGKTFLELAVAKTRPLDTAPLAAEVPAAMVGVIQRCLAPAKEDRPDSADELLAAVERALRGIAGGSGMIALPQPGAAAPAATVVVLPGATGPGDEYLAEGLAEDLADTLSRSPGLRVLPPTAVRGMSATGVSAGAALGVDHVIESSIRRRGADALRVSVRLVSVRDGFQVWADRRDVKQPELLAAGDELAEGVAGALSTAAERREDIDPRAVDLYLRARHNLRDFWGSAVEEAIQALEDAAAAAPSSAAIISTLAVARVRAWMLHSAPDGARRAREAADQAMALGPFHGEARYARAQVRMNLGDLVGGANDLGAAITLAPLLSDAHYTGGLVLTEVGQIEAGKQRFMHCMELDPIMRPMVEADLARVEALCGDWAAADARLDALLAVTTRHTARLSSLFKARLAGWRGKKDAALTEMMEPPKHSTFVVDTMMRAIRKMVAEGGVSEPEWLQQLDVAGGETRPVRARLISIQILSEVAMVHDRPELARVGLERAAQLGLFDVVWLERCPLWRSVSAEPWFGAVAAQVAARAQQVAAAYRAGLGGR
jgi:eukaryotic-like serine/threonine-protein kinase